MLSLAYGFIWTSAITSASLFVGALFAAYHGPLRPDRYGLEIMQQSLLVIVLMQFSLTGISTALLLRSKGMQTEIVLLLLVPFLTLAIRYFAPQDIVVWLVLSNWFVMWRILALREQKG